MKKWKFFDEITPTHLIIVQVLSVIGTICGAASIAINIYLLCR